MKLVRTKERDVGDGEARGQVNREDRGGWRRYVDRTKGVEMERFVGEGWGGGIGIDISGFTY